MPNPGKVKQWIVPGGKDVRVDSHCYPGYIVPSHYDSLIGKLIVWGETRERAIAKMSRALSEMEVSGIKTTIEFHRQMMKNPDFHSNDYDTKYLETWQITQE
jgi:acetyl-CoA carboxylase biotin carboxylase subunit